MSCIDKRRTTNDFYDAYLCPELYMKVSKDKDTQGVCLASCGCNHCFKLIKKRFVDVVPSFPRVDMTEYYGKKWFIIN